MQGCTNFPEIYNYPEIFAAIKVTR